MTYLGSHKFEDEVILVARILLALLFLISGWDKLTHYSETVGYMTGTGLPLPSVAALIAVVIEIFGAIGLILGIGTVPLAVLLALYTLATGFIGHHYWTLTGAERAANMTNFYKNVSIAGGFLLLYITGAGKYSLDAKLGLTGEK
jgi:putative oxidoreductase